MHLFEAQTPLYNFFNKTIDELQLLKFIYFTGFSEAVWNFPSKIDFKSSLLLSQLKAAALSLLLVVSNSKSSPNHFFKFDITSQGETINVRDYDVEKFELLAERIILLLDSDYFHKLFNTSQTMICKTEYEVSIFLNNVPDVSYVLKVMFKLETAKLSVKCSFYKISSEASIVSSYRLLNLVLNSAPLFSPSKFSVRIPLSSVSKRVAQKKAETIPYQVIVNRNLLCLLIVFVAETIVVTKNCRAVV